MENSTPNLPGLIFKIDSYKCAKLDLRVKDNENYFYEEIDLKIKTMIEEFKKINLKAIWLTLSISQSNVISHFYNNNFLFHHTEKNTDLVMYNWLLDTPCNLPKFASYYLGIGALIINTSGKILLVKEKSSLRKFKDLWKIPTGLAESGETIEQAVIREVKEETGLDITFGGILTLRETYPYLFDSTDIFLTCLCKCLNDEQKIDIEKGGELKDCKWFSTDEIKKLLEEDSKFSLTSSNLFNSILDLIPEKIFNYSLQNGSEFKVINSRMIFHSPKY